VPTPVERALRMTVAMREAMISAYSVRRLKG
jgi:hypothetical protein